MARKYVDCREIPSEMNCTVGIAADSEEELLEAAVQHAVAVHSHEDTPELREQIRATMKETEAAGDGPRVCGGDASPPRSGSTGIQSAGQGSAAQGRKSSRLSTR
jgi:predicted small metal-binding protein